MSEIFIYGASDDLIEVESSDFDDEEFNVYFEYRNPEPIFLAVSDGTLFRVRYDEDGIWRFTPLVVGSADVDIKLGVSKTDTVTMTGENLTWVALATNVAK